MLLEAAMDELLLTGVLSIEEANICELDCAVLEFVLVDLSLPPPQPTIVVKQAESRSAFIIFIAFSRFKGDKSRRTILLKTTGWR